MSIADKANAVSANNVTIAENEQKVYDAGADNVWRQLTNNGARTDGYRLFAQSNFDKDYILPAFVTSNLTYLYEAFNSYKGKYLPKGINFTSVKPGNNATYIFRGSESLIRVYDLGLPAMDSYYGANGYFYSCYSLKTVDVMRSAIVTKFANTFFNCSALENITFEGEIGTNINFQYSQKLTIDSLKSIINALFDYSGTENEYTYTLTLNSGCLATLEAEGAAAEYNGTACTWIELIDNKKWNLVT